MNRGNDPISVMSVRGMGLDGRNEMEIVMTKMLIAAAVATALVTPAFAQGAGPSPEALPPYAPDATSGYWSYGQSRDEFQTQAPAHFKHQRIVEGRNAAVIRDQGPTVGTWTVPDRATALGN
jgi:hypothetical protein